eukprot:3650267-Rhodomonas_salina.1
MEVSSFTPGLVCRASARGLQPRPAAGAAPRPDELCRAERHELEYDSVFAWVGPLLTVFSGRKSAATVVRAVACAAMASGLESCDCGVHR